MTSSQPLLFGKYKLLELVARGGMAEVFKAKSYGADGFEKVVVIKRILPDLAQNKSFVDMCITEAKLSVALSHANIVQVFDLGREEDTYFIVMEYVHGMDFAEVLRRCRRAGRRVPFELCVYIASETARALDYAHRRRDAQLRPLHIVHRDVSPQNVLLSFEGEVKVTDFGIAKARTTIEEQGAIKGKYAYMAPEQAQGATVDARADVFALGVVLYEALAGRNPFVEASPMATLRRVQEGDKPLLKSVAPEVPDELARIVETATAADLAQRYASAARLYEDLTGFLYTTGRRVAAHDLAEWLQELRDAPARDDEATRVRDALEEAEPSSARTPVEVPERAVASLSRPGPSTAAGKARPHLERRDVTLLSIEVTTGRGWGGRDGFEPLLTIARRYGGHVLDHTDDHAVVAFGTREPDGRDTEAAARCALKVRQAARRSAAGRELSQGIHAARLYVDSEGEPERDQWFTQALAQVRDLCRVPGGRIVASEPVGRLIGDQFALSPVRASVTLQHVAGTPLELTGERPAHESGGHKKYFGRREPFRKVGEVLARASKHGTRAVVAVGEPGMGKTRFLSEVHYRLKRMNHPMSWHGAACLPTERDVPFSALQAMLRAILGVDEVDPDTVVREKALRLRELGLTDEEQHALRVVLGVATAQSSAEGLTRALKGALLRVATRLAQDQLTVFVWDAAENMDDASQVLVDELVRKAGKARVVVLVACRPGFIYAWRDAGNVEEVQLGPLSDDELRQLVAHRLTVARPEAVPIELLEDLAAKGGGNPMFAEEYLRSLVDAAAVEVRDGEVFYRSDVAEIGVPKTLRGLVARETARLGPAARLVLQIASVAGPRFHRDVVVDVAALPTQEVDEALRVLVERGSLVAAAAGEFSFAHEVRREVVYEGLPLDARRDMHAAVAAALERLFSERLDDVAERLASHYRESNDRTRAVDFLARAARKRIREGAFETAVRLFARAIEWQLASPKGDPARVLALYSELGSAAVRGPVHEPGLEKLRLGLSYAEELGDTAATARMLLYVGHLFARGGHIGEAVAHFERARSLAAKLNDAALSAELATAMGRAFARNAEFKKAYRALEEAVSLAGTQGPSRDYVSALLSLAWCEAAAGEGSRAIATWERARDACSGSDDPVLRTELEKTLALIFLERHDYQASAQHSERAMEIAREFNLSYELAAAAHNSGDAWLRQGDYRRAFAGFKTSLDVALEHGYEPIARLDELYLAFIEAAKFGKPEGRAKVEASVLEAERSGSTLALLQAKYLLALLAREDREHEKMRKTLREALSLARETGNLVYAQDCERLLREVSSLPPAPPIRR